jgi:hypothetical protein
MYILDRAVGLWRSRAVGRPRRRRCALALAGGGVVGGMYQVGALAALEERLEGACNFEIYVGCSAGSVVASILANGVSAAEIYCIVDQDLSDPLNFGRNAVYGGDSFRQACGRFGRLMWAVGKNAMTEQASRIYSQNLLQLGLATLAVKHPQTNFFLLQPPRTDTPLFGPCMGFEASRAALRFGYASTHEWLETHGNPLLQHFVVATPLAA